VLGAKPFGHFIPDRYAAAVRAPTAYPALEPRFRRAEPRFRELIAWMTRYEADLLRLHGGGGPARFDQDWFPRLDAAAAYTLVRQTRPRRIVEIGSGHSTRFLARAIADEGCDTTLVAIDPAPRASLASLGIRHEARLLAEADPAILAELGPGDVLFVDSSHIAMPGTDVDQIVNDVLPRLPAGILVHFHDILLPDPYPDAWRWRGYNESIVVSALLQGGGFDLVFSSHWVASRHPGWLTEGVVGRLPLLPEALETSLWLRTL
jgi:hypothetical protein